MNKLIILFILSPLLIGCGASFVTDYDKTTDFSPYTTYAFYPDIDSGLSELDDTRIKRSTDSILISQGFQKSSTPSFLINFYAEEQFQPSQNVIGIGVGSGGGNVGVGVSGGIPIGGMEVAQKITLDFIDAEKDQLLWQGIIEAKHKERMRPREKDEYYFKLLKKLLAKFPPNN